MRRFQPKPKERRKIEIPSGLRETMQDVVELIEASKYDPEINIDFDDAIQLESPGDGALLCGGRYSKNPNRFEFTYYPSGRKGRWHLELTQFDVEDIADGRQSEILLYCCSNPECGEKFRKKDDSCFDCDYIDDPRYGTFEFPEAAEKLALWNIQAIDANSTRENVIALLGAPLKSGGGEKGPYIGYVHPWISYTRDVCRITLSFKKGRLFQVSIMERDFEPGKMPS